MSRHCVPWLLSLFGLFVPSSSGEEKPLAFVGKTVVLRYESGLEVKAHYSSATELAWEALAGPAKGQRGDEVIDAVQVAPEVFFISWLEEEGTSVSNVLDLGAKRVYAFVTFESGENRRRSLFDRGTVEILPIEERGFTAGDRRGPRMTRSRGDAPSGFAPPRPPPERTRGRS